MHSKSRLKIAVKGTVARLGGIGVGFLLGVVGNVLCLLAVVGLYSLLPSSAPRPHAPQAAPTAPSNPPVPGELSDTTGAREVVAAIPTVVRVVPPAPVQHPAPTVKASPDPRSEAATLRPRQVSYPETVASAPATLPAPSPAAAVPSPIETSMPALHSREVEAPPAPVERQPVAVPAPQVRPPEPPPVVAALPNPAVPSSVPPVVSKNRMLTISVESVRAVSHQVRGASPAPGNRFVVVEISLLDAANTLQLSDGRFEVKDQTGNVYQARTDLGTPWIVLSPGVTLSGNLVFEVPQDAVPHQLAFLESHGSPVTVVELTSIQPQ